MADPRRAQAVLVSAALMAGNASSYLFTIVAARMLAPPEFGGLSALVAVLVVAMVPALSLQTAAALYTARAGAGSEPFGLGLVVGAVVGLAALAAAPVLTHLLRLPDAGATLALPLAVAPYPVVGALYGYLQGRQRFGALASLLGFEAAARAGGALAGLLVGGTARAAIVGIAAGMTAVAVAGWLVCGRPAARRPPAGLLRLAAHAAYATVGLILLLNLDVILARAALPNDSGVYAVGLILTKVAYWLPQAVGVVVLPLLADPGRRRRSLAVAVAVVVLLDGPIVAVGAVAGNGLTGLIGGDRYGGLAAPLGIFALTGSLLAVAQLLLFSRIASADVRSVGAVWLAIGLEVGLVRWWLGGSVQQIATAAALAAGLLVAIGLLVELRGARNAQRAGRDGARGDEHGGLDDAGLGPVLALPGEPAGDRDEGRHPGAAEGEPRQGARAQ